MQFSSRIPRAVLWCFLFLLHQSSSLPPCSNLSWINCTAWLFESVLSSILNIPTTFKQIGRLSKILLFSFKTSSAKEWFKQNLRTAWNRLHGSVNSTQSPASPFCISFPFGSWICVGNWGDPSNLQKLNQLFAGSAVARTWSFPCTCSNGPSRQRKHVHLRSFLQECETVSALTYLKL